MLVLSRQRDETIMIGDDIELTIVDIRGDKVRVGISAPNSVSVHRKEVYEAIRKENEQAAAFRGDLETFHSGTFPRVVNGGTVPPTAVQLAARTETRRVTA
ncbi:MAG: carbon storage regulator CsrA [Planctomycetota bacterium]|nr:carbon storage regulator CsrA [Planctomycetota bacterium]